MSIPVRCESLPGAVVLVALLAFLGGCDGGGGGGSINAPPVARFTATPQSGVSPLSVSVDASASTDADGQITAYAWNFGDGSVAASGVTATHVYQSPGEFVLTLTVTDNRGAIGTAIQRILVDANVAPTAAFTVTPPAGVPPLTVSFDGSTSSDPDGSIAAYEWTFGDGATASGAIVQHTYVSAGRFEAELRVTDDRGATGSASQTIEVVSTVAAAWYSVTEIPTLGGWYIEPRRINDQGKVVGFGPIGDPGPDHAFLFSDGASIDLGTLGGASSYARDVNGAADVAGVSVTADGFDHAFLFRGGIMQDLGTLGGFNSEATAINDAGRIVGRAEDVDGFVRAFLAQGGTMTSLGTLGGDFSEAADINDKGQIAGTSNTESNEWHAFVYANGVMTDIGGGQSNSRVTVAAINDSGDVVGMWVPTAGYAGYTGFLYRGGTMSSLVDGSSEPADINDGGVVVGYAPFDIGGRIEGRAFVWDATSGMQDLNTLFDPSLGWTLVVAAGINDLGQIVARGTRAGGASVTVVLTPASKPSP